MNNYIAPSTVPKRTFYISNTNGTDSNNCGNENNPCKSIELVT